MGLGSGFGVGFGVRVGVRVGVQASPTNHLHLLLYKLSFVSCVFHLLLGGSEGRGQPLLLGRARLRRQRAVALDDLAVLRGACFEGGGRAGGAEERLGVGLEALDGHLVAVELLRLGGTRLEELERGEALDLEALAQLLAAARRAVDLADEQLRALGVQLAELAPRRLHRLAVAAPGQGQG